jgi:2',3'-cyclic-nucleotide 2'-phosphodiesterase
MRVLFLGDIVGRTGRQVLARQLPTLAEEFRPDAVVVNGENAAGGFGLTAKIVQELAGLGVHAITTGNHVWDKREAHGLLEGEYPLMRPHNYPPGNPGSGLRRLSIPGGRALWIFNIQGRVLMPPVDCPFRCADDTLPGLPPSEPCILVDFHAEATSEKRAMGWYLDGRVSAVIGTHTHVPTADEEVLPKGTGYLTDAGMTGGYASVIGMEFQDSLDRMLLGTPRLLNVAEGDPAVSGVLLDLDDKTGRCTKVARVFRKG